MFLGALWSAAVPAHRSIKKGAYVAYALDASQHRKLIDRKVTRFLIAEGRWNGNSSTSYSSSVHGAKEKPYRQGRGLDSRPAGGLHYAFKCQEHSSLSRPPH